MARIAAGDHGAFASFARRHAARCLGIAQRMIGNTGEAEDIVQDALLRVWQNAGTWRGGAAAPTWLHRIVVNLALDHLRRQRPSLLDIASAAELADAAPGPEAQLSEHETASAMARFIAELPDRQRTALMLCCDDRHDRAEAAAILDISLSALESLLVRARRTLRGRMRHLSGESGDAPAFRCARKPPLPAPGLESAETLLARLAKPASAMALAPAGR